MDYVPKRLFTPEQANKMLPLVRRIAEDVSGAYRDLVTDYEACKDILSIDPETLTEGHREELDDVKRRLEMKQARVAEYAEELDELGVLLKGEADGLLDFPCEHEGRVVFLCWKLGESQIRYWHEIEAGFRGRQPLWTDDPESSSTVAAEPTAGPNQD
ncbi:hypothetical protein Pan216_28010 [Planctomycetes bacterium Pan216]|uniref:DUF2203 domain-containing protein n=1 Tax=Kolteria novifilia TaxID=2527975 RepID=A0A518B4S5_9BACT|nr:hypothetical protein Pan216_28010 [Planctomycetes bacterium Pan216]